MNLIAKAVCSNYVDGIPLHCHPTKQDQSVFKVLSQHEYNQLSDREIQTVLRHRHLVIHNMPHRKMNFRQALRTLGGGDERPVPVQGS